VGTCKTCKWWDNGRCELEGSESIRPATRFEIEVTVDDDTNLQSCLRTGPDFGCIHHKPKA
jgi:hypothetical protein